MRHLYRPIGWWRDAACLEVNTEKFFPHGDDREGNAAAKAFCARCPVTGKCLEYALETNQRFGVWGGLTESERRRTRRLRRTA